MVDPQGYGEFISYIEGQVCSTVQYIRQPCICMVDTACSGEAQPHHWKSEFKVFGLNARVWHQDLQVSARGKLI